MTAPSEDQGTYGTNPGMDPLEDVRLLAHAIESRILSWSREDVTRTLDRAGDEISKLRTELLTQVIMAKYEWHYLIEILEERIAKTMQQDQKSRPGLDMIALRKRLIQGRTNS